MKTKNLIKGLVGIGLIGVAVGGVGYLSEGFKNWDLGTWFDTVEKTPEEEEAITTFSVDGIDYKNGESVALGSAITVSQNLAATLAANPATLSLTATVLPEYATDRALTWSLTFKNSPHYVVSDYVSISTSADTFTSTITIKQAFDDQIIITATNGNLSKSCTLDYAYRPYSTNYEVSKKSCNGVGYDDSRAWAKDYLDLLDEVKSNYGIDWIGSVGSSNETVIIKGVSFEGSYNGKTYSTDIIDIGIIGDTLYEMSSDTIANWASLYIGTNLSFYRNILGTDLGMVPSDVPPVLVYYAFSNQHFRVHYTVRCTNGLGYDVEYYDYTKSYLDICEYDSSDYLKATSLQLNSGSLVY